MATSSKTDSILFVVYRTFPKNVGIDPVLFDFTDIPKDWKWFGSGPAPAPFENKFAFEEQFLGSSLSESEMINYLNLVFRKLVSKGQIENFTVCKCNT